VPSPVEPLGDPDFRRLWLGETVSLLGTQVTTLALPLTAILALDAGPGELGLLGVAAFLPFLVFGLPAGAWVDRRRRRGILVAANLGRALLIALVPLAALAGQLRFELLLAVTFLAGMLTVVFEVAHLSYVPRLVDRDRLVAANARLMASSSTADIAGPGLAGFLVAAVSAPVAIAIDAVSYLVAALAVLGIRREEPEPDRAHRGARDIVAELREGLGFVARHPLLRPLALEAVTFNVFAQVMTVVLLLYATRTLGLDAPMIGLVFSAAAVGSLAGALTTARIERRFGLGPTVAAMMVVACSAPLLVPVAGGSPALAAAVLVAGFAIEGYGVAGTVVHTISIRQAATPDRLLGRMHATYRTLTYGFIPLGAALGGLLGEAVGLHATLVVATVGIALAPLWVLLSPVRRLRSLDQVAATAAEWEAKTGHPAQPLVPAFAAD
jgi:MFS family permease